MKVEDELVPINMSDRRTCENAGRALFITHQRRYIRRNILEASGKTFH